MKLYHLMKANNLKKEIQIAGFFWLFIFSYDRINSQDKVECSCPINKGQILYDTSFVTMGCKIIPEAMIKGKACKVYSAGIWFYYRHRYN